MAPRLAAIDARISSVQQLVVGFGAMTGGAFAKIGDRDALLLSTVFLIVGSFSIVFGFVDWLRHVRLTHDVAVATKSECADK